MCLWYNKKIIKTFTHSQMSKFHHSKRFWRSPVLEWNTIERWTSLQLQQKVGWKNWEWEMIGFTLLLQGILKGICICPFQGQHREVYAIKNCPIRKEFLKVKSTFSIHRNSREAFHYNSEHHYWFYTYAWIFIKPAAFYSSKSKSNIIMLKLAKYY